ncbi:sensor histidine kinase [Chryseomicrobium palamuruense]|uniref:Signal transduction histidine-protein kinase ArlS n=1 Tax=Chryseomicrobium palamuruense TaxID=682973 RepID=A0ABV8UU39_9BACL
MKGKTDSLRFKWSLWTATSMVLTYFFLAALLYTALSQWVLASERETAKQSLSELQSYMESRGAYLSIQDFERNTGLLNQFLSRNQSARILNRDGIELLQINSEGVFPRFDGPTNQFVQLEVNNHSILYRAIEIPLGNDRLFVAVSHSLASYESMLSYLLWALILFAILFIIAAGFAGYFLSSYLIQPLENLRNAMQSTMPGKGVRLTPNYTKQDEIGELTKEFNRLLKRMDDVYAMQERFIGNVSHELRSPVQAIEGNIALLTRWGKDDPEVLHETLSIVQQEIYRMKEMMEALLALAKQHELTSEVIFVKEEMKEATRLFKEQYPDIKILLQVEQAEIELSRILFHQIVMNLLTNAIRYSNEHPSIQIKSEKTSHEYRLIFHDNGVGIAEKHFGKLFEPFYTIDETRSKESGGTGLGLTFVRQVMERAGGEIRVYSEPGKGSEFHLLFPQKAK